VRRTSPASPLYSNTIPGAPDQEFEYNIQISNFGRKSAQQFEFKDIFEYNNAFVGNGVPYGLAINFSPGFDPLIQADITSQITTSFTDATINGLTNFGFSIDNFPGVSGGNDNCVKRVTITFKVKSKNASEIYCATENKNKATVAYYFDNQDADNTNDNHNLEDDAAININFFNGIYYGIQATCTPNNPNSWQSNSIDAVPGQTIYYRVRIKSNLPYAINNLRLMVQHPNGTDNVSDHNAITNYLASTTPVMPPGTGLIPISINASPPPLPTNRNTATDNFLSGAPILFNSGTNPIKANYKLFNLLAFGQQELTFNYTIPSNVIGSLYKTVFGLSRISPNGAPNCLFMVKDSINTIIMPSNVCSPNSSGCDSIFVEGNIAPISGSGNYNVNLSNFYSAPGNSFNISEIDVIVHQPYKTCPTNPAPIPGSNTYANPVYAFTPSTLVAGYSSNFGSASTANNSRMYTITGVGNNLSFGSFNFNINIGGVQIGADGLGCNNTNSKRVLPINIVFKDKNKCIICEKMMLLTIPKVNSIPF
jgi:hypothetical protein